MRGLNTPARRSVIHDTSHTHKVAILCIQETKIDCWSTSLAREIGGTWLDQCIFLPAIGTRGGAAIFWNSSMLTMQSHSIGQFSITAKVQTGGLGKDLWLTMVYGPSDEDRKDDFLAEIARVAPPIGQAWLINGDFNIIYEARDKNNSNINRRIMGKFRAAIDAGGLREIKCKNRRFTWSNERRNPTLVSIDKFFCTIAWEGLFPSFLLHAASSSCSDHCPLLLAPAAAPRRPTTFRFECFWPRYPRFQETVQRAWNRPTTTRCAFARLHEKMRRVARDLKIWSKSQFGGAKLHMHIATEVVLRLDVAQETRALSDAEFHLRKMLKLKILGLAAIDRARKRQASRITWLRAGDAPTAFFQAKINSRRRKNHIHSLQTETGVATAHGDKATIAHAHFLQLLGTRRPRSCSINWDSIQLPSVQNAGLDNPFTESEVWEVIMASPSEKAPGPDGYTMLFFRAC